MSRSRELLLGLCSLVLILASTSIVIHSALGEFSTDYTIYVTFPRTGEGLTRGGAVKIRGVTVGQVNHLALLPDGRTEVTLGIHHNVRLPRSTTVTVEPLSIFGPTYVDLHVGSPGSGDGVLAHGAHVVSPSSPTALTPVLAQASHLLDAIDPQDLLTVLHTSAEGLAGLGPILGQALDHSSKLAGILDAHRADIAAIMSNSATIAQLFDRTAPAALEVILNLNGLLPGINARASGLDSLLAQTTQLSALGARIINDHAPALDQVLVGLRPFVSTLYERRTQLGAFIGYVDDLINFLGKYLFRAPLPDGHIMAVLKGSPKADVCTLILPFPGCPTPPTLPPPTS
jgi:phospholipid/cholesterol/gamma-HCH transport system substrate-binding protein